MAVISAKLSIGEIECMVGIRYNHTEFVENKRGAVARERLSPDFPTRGIPTVNDFSLSPGERLASALASAAIVRDVAALGAIVLFGTMLVLVLSSADFFV